jgi:hypothetical protein
MRVHIAFGYVASRAEILVYEAVVGHCDVKEQGMATTRNP